MPGFTAEEYSKYLSIMGKAFGKKLTNNALVEAGLSRQKAAQSEARFSTENKHKKRGRS